MKIRDRLTLQFTGIVAVILMVFCATIYFLTSRYTHNEFDGRLKERASNTADLLLKVDEIDEVLLKSMRRRYLQSLPNEFVRIYDTTYKIVFRDDTSDIHFENQVFDKIKHGEGYDYEEGERQFVGMFYRDNQGDFYVIASAVDKYGKTKLNNLKLVLIIGYILTLLLLLLSGRFFSIAALNPISKIVEKVESINASKMDMRLDEGKGKDEISKLAYTFNQMFERIEKAFITQKQFVSNASHELRTPLTSITGEIEVALMKNRSEEEYKEVLKSILEEAQNLTKLSNGLLSLAQSGIDEGSIKVFLCRVDEIIFHVQEEIVNRNPQDKLSIEISDMDDEKNLLINANAELLTIAIINVVENAFKFSGRKPVVVKIFNKNDSTVTIAIKDQGSGISKEDQVNIFQPFYRGTASNKVSGHGIGLSLTDKIIRLHKGIISIESTVLGTEFALTFPVASEF